MISIKTDENAPKEVLQNRLKRFMKEARTRLQDPDDCFVGLDQIKTDMQRKRGIQIVPAASSRPRKAVLQTR